jgi:hypothetical protein
MPTIFGARQSIIPQFYMRCQLPSVGKTWHDICIVIFITWPKMTSVIFITWPKMTSVIKITWPKMTSVIFITSLSL